MRRRSRCSNHRPATRPFSTHRRRCANNDDAITIKSDDAGSDTVAFLFEAPDGGRVAEFELRLMDITSENLGIPDTEYAATVKMPSAEFARIVRDLASIGDTVVIAVTTVRGWGEGEGGVFLGLGLPSPSSFLLLP